MKYIGKYATYKCDNIKLGMLAGTGLAVEASDLRKCFQPPAHLENICRPTPVRAVESEPDLIRLAHSLISLNPSKRLSPSDTSAFRIAESVRE